MLELSDHAQRRKAQRGIRNTQIAMVYQYGTLVYCKNAIVVWVDKKAIQNARYDDISLEQYRGIYLVVSRVDGKLITLYRNKNGGIPARIGWRKDHAQRQNRRSKYSNIGVVY